MSTQPGAQPGEQFCIGHAGKVTANNKFSTIDNLIMSIPKLEPKDIDAIVAIPGIMLEAPIRFACKLWEIGVGKHLLIAGYHEQPVVDKLFTPETFPTQFSLQRKGDVRFQGHAGHTGMQASWIAEQTVQLGIKSIMLVAPAFHLPRVYLTILEALRRKNVRVVISPAWPSVSPFERSLLDVTPGKEARNLAQLDALPAEADPRMQNYMKPKTDGSPGDVATLEYFIEHLEWVYEQPIVKKGLMSDMHVAQKLKDLGL